MKLKSIVQSSSPVQWSSPAVQSSDYRFPKLSYSGKLSREKTFANFVIMWLYVKVFSMKFGGVGFFCTAKASNPQKFLSENCIFYKFVKVFFLKSFPLYSIPSMYCPDLWWVLIGSNWSLVEARWQTKPSKFYMTGWAEDGHIANCVYILSCVGGKNTAQNLLRDEVLWSHGCGVV